MYNTRSAQVAYCATQEEFKLPIGLSHAITPGLHLDYTAEFAKLLVCLHCLSLANSERLSFCVFGSLKMDWRQIAIGLEQEFKLI